MVKQIVNEIIAAEKQAEEILAVASARAKEIRQAGEEESAGIVAEGKKSAAELLASLEKETDLAAIREGNAVLEKGRKEAQAVRQGAEGMVAEAAEKVKARLLEKYGVTAL